MGEAYIIFQACLNEQQEIDYDELIIMNIMGVLGQTVHQQDASLASQPRFGPNENARHPTAPPPTYTDLYDCAPHHRQFPNQQQPPLHQQHHLPDHQNPQHNIPHCNRNQSSHGVMFDMNQQSAHFQQQHPYQHDRLTYNDNNINSYNNNQGMKPSSQFPVPKSDSNNNNIIVIPQMQPPVIAPSYPMTSQPPNVTAINVGGPGGYSKAGYKRKANHLVHCLLSILFPPWICVWLIMCCCYGCPEGCCCCEECCPKYYESGSMNRPGTTWV